MPFKKGQSGNPGGKPKLPEDIVALAREHSPLILKRLIEFATGKRECEPTVAIRAAEAVLNRAWGTPRQSVEFTGDLTSYVMRLPAVAASPEEWERKIAAVNGNGHVSD
jgi:hypothetical protein